MIGGGSWGTALVKLLTENNHEVNWWIRDEKIIHHLKTKFHNPNYLSAVLLDAFISPTHDARQVLESSVIFLAVPSSYIKNVLSSFSAEDFQNKIIVSAIKGMVPDDNLIIAEFLKKYLKVPFKNIVIVSGPCHAEEVALEKLSYLTVASEDQSSSAKVCKLLQCPYLITIPSNDIYGTEYAAVLKNIYALGAGICHGLGYGDNFLAVFISNCITEMEHFVKAVHPIDRDIKDSAYLGDLLVTSYSQFSRNRTLGTMIGKGYSVQAALIEMKMVAEGYNASNCIHEVNKNYKVKMPIANAIYKILYENAGAAETISGMTQILN